MVDDTQTTTNNTQDQSGAKTSTTNQTTEQIRSAEVHKVSIKPPQFVKDDPELFFLQLEAQFRNAGISVDQTKFDYVVSSLEPTYVRAAADIIRNPPGGNKYDAIKRRLIEEYTDSEQRKLRRLVQEIELGDDKPSQLLRKMKNLAGDSITDDVIKSLWIQRLPENVRAVVSIADCDSTVWARQADKMMEITNFSAISSIKPSSIAPVNAEPSHNNNNSQIQYLINEIKKIQTSVEHLKRGNNSNNTTNKSNSTRSRSKTPQRKYPFCRYHFKFGAKARKCIQPCDFPDSSENKTQPEN